MRRALARRAFAQKAERRSFDVVVIGGGSGGLACATQLRRLSGKSVAVFDFVPPSPRGSRWGLGGTCVNVGCIPKKLFHAASLARAAARSLPGFGLGGALALDFPVLAANVRGHLQSLNFQYRSLLRAEGVTYLNEMAAFAGPHTLVSAPGTLAPGRPWPEGHRLTEFGAAVVAVGGRPQTLGIPGAEHVLTSDDVFFLERLPARVVIIGGGYIAHECASYLALLGSRVTPVTRRGFLQAFDRQAAEVVCARMEAEGVEFVPHATPLRVEKTARGFDVHLRRAGGAVDVLRDANVVLAAVSRRGTCDALNTEGVFGAALRPTPAGKLVGGWGGEAERLGESLYAIGDCLEGSPELTPIAARAGREVARRLTARLAGEPVTPLALDYAFFPSTVFTSPEYSFCGLSSAQAAERFGTENVAAFHRSSLPLELSFTPGAQPSYFKVVCLREGMRVLGLHYVGPQAGEVMQGFAAAVALGLTKQQLDAGLGIHPTAAEDFLGIETPADQPLAVKRGC